MGEIGPANPCPTPRHKLATKNSAVKTTILFRIQACHSLDFVQSCAILRTRREKTRIRRSGSCIPFTEPTLVKCESEGLGHLSPISVIFARQMRSFESSYVMSWAFDSVKHHREKKKTPARRSKRRRTKTNIKKHNKAERIHRRRTCRPPSDFGRQLQVSRARCVEIFEMQDRTPTQSGSGLSGIPVVEDLRLFSTTPLASHGTHVA